MTQQRRDNHSTEFGIWLRNQPEIDSHEGFDGENLDYVWFQFLEGWLITIEEKRYGFSPSKAQKDTHGIVKQMLQIASGFPIETMRGIRPIEYRGHYLVQFEKTNPDDSKWIKINGNVHTKTDLLILLQFGILMNLRDEIKQCKTDDSHTEISEKYGIDIPWIYILSEEQKIENRNHTNRL